MRTITNDDLWAAIRGLELTRKSDVELDAIMRQHADKVMTMFASAVIVEACRQVMAGKLNRLANS